MKLFAYFIVLISLATVTAANDGTHVGIVDVNAVIQQSAKGKAFVAEYEKLIKSRQDEINAKTNELIGMQQDAQAKAATLSDEQKQATVRELETLQISIKRLNEDAQNEAQRLMNTKLNEFSKVLLPLIRQVAQEKGLDMVLNYTPNSNLLYFSDAINITMDVVKKYDAQ